ncbi:enoyl-CoA hydratase/isomerase family protein [Bordetella sp. BOR01]|uniref:enoyl-CoA hydratase/isomerase family protein n=1 Tax=Bordetella sp. BOR01 TaxID=2854779 RepID=UPI001C43F15C|nr:enoyl-CoA hydratase-related protein [Bordetella sp. BOR01]MBV7482209.1 enoyl-CoA hydratase/isomerase family protein [Bordetella sp. BOR01]
MGSVEITVEDHVATVLLNRPEAMNAVDPEMRGLLHQAWDRIRQDDDIWVAVVTGAGERAFCTGSDLKKTLPTAETAAQQLFGSSPTSSLIANLHTDKPMIAAINGYAMGGGLELALACDIRICSDNAQFALPEVKVGSMPGAGGTARLPRYIGRSDAMLMLLTGSRTDAAEAHRIGLVSKVLQQAALLPEALAIARAIAANAPLSVRAVKRMVRQGEDMPLGHAIDTERALFGLLYNSEDRTEGRKAFAERRKPQFKGR